MCKSVGLAVVHNFGTVESFLIRFMRKHFCFLRAILVANNYNGNMLNCNTVNIYQFTKIGTVVTGITGTLLYKRSCTNYYLGLKMTMAGVSCCK